RDKCPSFKNCNHYLRTVMSRKKNVNKNVSKSTRFYYSSKEELIVTAQDSSKTIKKLQEKLKRSDESN
ncbi:Hypothetical predicted protein, partial [Paramuricea clavata]